MQPTYPDRTPDRTPDQTSDWTPTQTQDQAAAPVSSTQPTEPVQPTAPIRPMARDDQPAQAVPVEPVQRAPVVTPADRAAMVVWLILGIVEALLIIRVILKLLAANPAAGFVQFVYGVTAPLVAPFQGIFPTPASARSVLELSSLVAIVVYALIAWGIVRLLAILDPRRGQSAA